MIKIAIAAVVGCLRACTIAAICICTCTLLYRDTAMGLSLVAALASYWLASRLANKIDAKVSDVDTPPDGEEDYNLF